MFTVKATYKQETRKFKFSDSIFFPSYDQLNHQLSRVFPISHNYILSKLLFSPDSTRPAARILIGKEVRNTEDYRRAIEPLQGRVFAGALLRFWVSDETTHAAATFNRSNVSQLPRRLNDPEPSWSPSFTSATPAYPVNWDLFNSPASAIPPPPIIFSTPPVASGSPLSLPRSPQVHGPPQQTPMDIDGFNYSSMMGFYQHSPTPEPGNTADFWNNGRLVTPQLLGGTQHLPNPPQQPQTSRTTSTSSSCCSVSQGKADIQSLLETFKSDLNRIMDDIFSPSNSEPRNSPPITAPAVPGAWPEPLAPCTVGTTRPCVNMWCMICGKLFGGPWYSCDKCSWHVLCSDCVGGHGADHGRNFGEGHIINRRTCSGCPPEHVQTPAPNPVPAPTVATDRAATPTPAPVVHAGVICDRCENTIVGVRHKCLDCPDYDLCAPCIKAGSAERHNPFHEFFEIEEPGRVVVHTVFSGNGEMDSSGTPRRTDSTAARDVPNPVLPSAEPVTHNAFCDLCDSNIRGTRYKCLDCMDFDTCSACFNLAPEQHPYHGFVRIHNVGDLIMRDRLATNTRRYAPLVPSPVVAPAEPVIHNATCDLCDSKICGVRYKCVNCIDFDTCSSCFNITPEQHPHHGFVKIHNTDDLMMRDGLGASTRHYAKCDGCKKDIYGVRYKCMHPDCPDFDLCAMCEAHPIPTHPSKHPMLKMKTADTAIPTVYRVGQTTLIKDRGSVKDNAARDEEKALPTPPMATNADNENPAAEILSAKGHTVNTDSSLASSTAGFTLPPLALDPRNDLFREFWPKVTEELKQTQGSQATSHIVGIQQPIPVEPIASVPAPTNVEVISDPFCDPKPNANFIPSPDLSTQALLTRPMSVPTMPEMAQQTMTPVTTHSRSLAALLNGYRSPSPNFTTSLAASMSSLDGISQNETTPAIPASPAQEVVFPLMAFFVSDMTVHDGQIFPPGAEFVKCWRMVNNGTRDWPETTELHYSAGETFSLEHSGSQKVKVGKVAAGLQADVWSGELKAPEAPGKYRGYWRLSDGEGTYFGHSLWVDIVVAEVSRQADGSERSLASSSIIVMPQSAASARSIAQSDLTDHQGNQQTFPLTRNLSLPVSKSSVDDTTSDGGSIGSSVSLISVPSEDEDEDDWRDSRSHVVNPSPENFRDAAEYIVLFDDTSSDEE